MKIVLGVTGCVGAYKAALVLRLLQEEGATVYPVMTRGARQFLGPMTLEALSGNPVISDWSDPGADSLDHIHLARRSELLLVAPATANILAKFAAGIADDFLSTLYLATRTPVAVAPAMNVEMWRHPATLSNVEMLRRRGVHVIEPESGYQACGEVGEGRLAEPREIVREVLALLSASRSLAGRTVLVTAGPTIEDIDSVRYLSNRSSGRMGYAIAREAVRRSARVHLVSGPTALPSPYGVQFHPVRSAAEMERVVLQLFPDSDIVVKAAAVADYRPAEKIEGKLKKTGQGWTLELVPTEDILSVLGRRRAGQFLVGFAAEAQDPGPEAARKLKEKGLDLIVANEIGRDDSGFEVEANRVVMIDRRLQEIRLPLLPKEEVARRIWDHIETLYLPRSQSVSEAPVTS